MESVLTSRIDDIERLYRIQDKNEVMAFLATRPELVDILIEARPHIELQFGPDVEVVLRWPRFEEDQPRRVLFAMIQTPLDAQPAMDRINAFWDEWWGDASGRPAAFQLCIDFDFAPEDNTQS